MSYLKILKSFVYFFSLFSVFSAHLAHAQNNLDSLPPECSIFTPVVIPALRSGLYLQRMQISEISATILKNAPTDRKLSHQVAFVIKKQADKALEQALRAVAAFKVIRCTEPTSCQMESLQQEKDRIMFASRKIADVALRLFWISHARVRKSSENKAKPGFSKPGRSLASSILSA